MGLYTFILMYNMFFQRALEVVFPCLGELCINIKHIIIIALNT